MGEPQQGDKPLRTPSVPKPHHGVTSTTTGPRPIPPPQTGNLGTGNPAPPPAPHTGTPGTGKSANPASKTRTSGTGKPAPPPATQIRNTGTGRPAPPAPPTETSGTEPPGSVPPVLPPTGPSAAGTLPTQSLPVFGTASTNPLGHLNSLVLYRPARGACVELRAPFTVDRVLAQIRELCKPIGQDWTVRIFPTEAAWINDKWFAVHSNVESDNGARERFEKEFGSRVQQDGRVYIFKEIVRCSPSDYRH